MAESEARTRRVPRESTGEAPGSRRPATRDRSAIPERFRWDLSHIYPEWADWEADLATMRGLMECFGELRGTLADGPHRLLAALQASDRLGMTAYRVHQYASLKSSEDTRDNTAQARLQQVQIELARFRQTLAWLEPEILAIPVETVRAWLETTAELGTYRFHLLELYRRGEHVLDEDGERLLAFAARFSSSPRHTYSMLSEADVRFPVVRLSSGEEVVASHAAYANGLRSSRLQRDREVIFRGHFSVFDERPNTHAAIYDGVLQRDWFVAQARRYPSCLEASLDGDAIPLAVVEGLVETARASSGPLRRYHRLRRRRLGLERYRFFDAYVPLVDVEWPMYFDEVARLVVASVVPLGDDYQRTVERAFSERWLDVYENEGKRSGAFSAGVWGVHPYMLLNHADTLGDAFTVAHEMGHTMHSVLAQSSQPFVDASYSIFVAEVASMTGEALFLDAALASELDPARRAVLLQQAVDSVVSSFYRQTMLADFELAAHRMVERGEPVTAERLQAVYLATVAKYIGDDVDDLDWYRNEWARIPHLVQSPFYVFQYATSRAAASLLHRSMTAGDAGDRAEAVGRFLDLLRAGGSDQPLELLRRAGVDFATTEPLEALVATMGELLDRLEEELDAEGPGA